MTQLFPELRTEEATDAADSLFYTAKDLITAHQRTIVTFPVLIVSALAITGLFTLGSRGLRAGIGTGPYNSSLAWIVLSGVMLIIVLIWSNRGHYLTLDTRLESPSFFAKNREEFGKQAVIATISGLIGGAIGYLFGHYLK
jgi:hypothetical protein